MAGGAYRSSSARAAGAKRDPYVTRIIVMVDEATEPGITDEEGERRRVELVNIVQSGGNNMYDARSESRVSGGQAVAFAVRKRLKSEDEVAVLNTLTLLDELMRTCPYFYRFVANDKFFRRLWRFVVPDYKDGVKAIIPFVGKNKSNLGMRLTGGGAELAERVLILIRAWAEELSVMYNGRYDPDAGFLIERYNNKRARVKFPEVPSTPLPWVCPITNDTSAASAQAVYHSTRNQAFGRGSGPSAPPLPKSLSLSEVENTVNLFENLLEKAADMDEIRGDLCKDLATRCRLISNNIDEMSMRMDKEEDLTRAIHVSELLHRSLATYDRSIETGELARSIPIVDGMSLHSEDEGYEPSSVPRYPGERLDSDLRRDREDSDLRRQRRDEPLLSSGESDFDESEGSRGRVRRQDSDAEDMYDEAQPRRGGERDAPQSSVKSRSVRKAKASASSKPPSRKASHKKSAANSSRKPEKSSKASSVAEEGRKNGAAKQILVDVDAAPSVEGNSSSTSSSSLDDPEKTGGAFTMLAERYQSSNPNQSLASSSSSAAAGGAAGAVSTQMMASGKNSMTVGEAGSNAGAPQAQHQHQQGPGQMSPMHLPFPYSPMVMMPNPMAMYGSVNPMSTQDPNPVYSAYNTINPSLFYGTVNPLAFSGMGHAPPSAPPMPSQAPLQVHSQAPAPHMYPNNIYAVPQQEQIPTGQQDSVAAIRLTPEQLAFQQQQQQLHMRQMYYTSPGLLSMPQPMTAPYQSGTAMPPIGSAPSPRPSAHETREDLPLGGQQSISPSTPLPAHPQPFVATPASEMLAAPQPSIIAGSVAPNTLPGSVQEQAAAYQSAMRDAAAAYQAAATAYQSIQGQPPVQQNEKEADQSQT